MSTRALTLGLHEWSLDDTILSYYHTVYGMKLLYLKDEKQLSEFIGTTECSLIKQSMNFRTLLGRKSKTLSDYSKLQEDVHEMFKDISFNEFFRIVKTIIKQDDFERLELLRKKGVNVTKLVLMN